MLLFTVHRWASDMPAALFMRAIAKRSLILVLVAYSPIQRLRLAEFLLYSLAVVALTWRFVVRRPAMTTLVDRLALTFFVVANLNQLVVPYSFPPLWLWRGAGVIAGTVRHRSAGMFHDFNTQ